MMPDFRNPALPVRLSQPVGRRLSARIGYAGATAGLAKLHRIDASKADVLTANLKAIAVNHPDRIGARCREGDAEA